MSTNVTNCTSLSTSSDLLGVGIRINLYSTILFVSLLGFIPRTPNTEKLSNSLHTNAGIAGFGILLTAIIQTSLKQLFFFEALFVLHILFFLGAGVLPMSKYYWTWTHITMNILGQFVWVITFTVWGLYVWADVNKFGNHATCNDQIKYVIFFFSIRATAPWLRGIWIACLVLNSVLLMLSSGWRAMELYEMKRMAEQMEVEVEEQSHENSNQRLTCPNMRPDFPRSNSKPMAKELEEAETEKGNAFEKGWFFNISFVILFPGIYSTVMLELTVRRNIASGVISIDNSWTFGQILAVVMILPTAKEVLYTCFDFLAKRKRRRLAHESHAQTEEIALRHEAQLESAPTFYGSRGPSVPNVSARDQPTDNISTEHERQNLDSDKRNAEVSETISLPSVSARDQSTDKISTEHDRQNLDSDKRNAEVSETISLPNVSARDQSTDKISTEHERQNLDSDKRNAEVSETISLPNVSAHDQSTDKISAGHERQNLDSDKRNAKVSETISLNNVSARDQLTDNISTEHERQNLDSDKREAEVSETISLKRTSTGSAHSHVAMTALPGPGL